MIAISPQTIDALALVISCGGGNDPTPPIGLYRSGPKLESFMRGCGIMMNIGSASRVPTLVTAITDTVNSGNAEALRTIIERAADPRDFIQDPEKFEKVLGYLNSYLMHDGYELQQRGSSACLVKRGTSAPVISALSATVATIDFDTVQRDLDRALASAETDPEDAVTAACSVSKASAVPSSANWGFHSPRSLTCRVSTKLCVNRWAWLRARKMLRLRLRRTSGRF